MASILDNPAVREAAWRLSPEQYHRLDAAGLIPEQTELLRGVVVAKMMKSPLHSWVVELLGEQLRAVLEPGWRLRQEQPLALSDSEPEPDLAVVAGTSDDFRQSHPTTAAWVIEIALASAELDRAKAEIYAAAGISDYWIVLPDERAVEIHAAPGAAGYQRVERHEAPALLAPATHPAWRLNLATLWR